MLLWIIAIGLPLGLGSAIAHTAANVRRSSSHPDWQEVAYGMLAGWGLAVLLRWLRLTPDGFHVVMFVGTWLLAFAAIASYCFSNVLTPQASPISSSLWKVAMRRHLRWLRPTSSREATKRLSTWWSRYAWACLVTYALCAISDEPSQSQASVPPPIAGLNGPVAIVPLEIGLSMKQLSMCSPMVYTSWNEDDELFGRDQGGAQGSTCPLLIRDGKLLLGTNLHCLNLDGLAASGSQSDDVPDIVSFEIQVKFITGVSRRVTYACIPAAGLQGTGLAILEVDATGLREGVDFVLLEPMSEAVNQLVIGEDTVAVGSPYGLEATHTFGRISQMRGDDKLEFVQTDAPINPGNSGGPLFVRRKDRFHWIGINTLIYGSDNLGFAIGTRHLFELSVLKFEADAAGVVGILNSLGHKAVVHPIR